MIYKEEKITVFVSEVVLYTLLYIDKIDNIDLALIIKDIKDSYNVKFRGTPIDSEGRFFLTEDDNGTIYLDNNHSFHEKYPGSNISIMDYILENTKPIIKNYFRNFDRDKFKEKKEKLLNEVRDNVLENGNVLLISEYDSDYNELIKKGFKNILFFKSLILANKYFNDNPNILEKFDLVIFGKSSIADEMPTKLESDVEALCARCKMVKLKFYPSKVLNPVLFYTYYTDYVIGNTFTPNFYSVSDVYDSIFKNILINDINKNISSKRKFAPKVIDYSKVDKISLPRSVSDLKIAFFSNFYLFNLSQLIDIIENNVSLNLGINTTYFSDNNFAFDEKLKDKLGQFDIIIASNEFSSKLIHAREECNEQCKDTGRELMMSFIYDYKNIKKYDLVNGHDENGLGSKVNLKYYCAGNLSDSDKISEINYKVLREKYDGNTYLDICYNVVKSILEVAIGIYNKKLTNATGKGISGFKYDLDTFDDLTRKFEQAEEQYNKMIEEITEPISIYDSLISALEEYLSLKKDAINGITFKGLKISKYNNNLLLHLYLPDSRLAAILTLNIDYNENINNCRTFKLQSLNNKGKLSKEINYVISLEEKNIFEGNYEYASEKELKVLKALRKRINDIIESIYDSKNNSSYKKYIK